MKKREYYKVMFTLCIIVMSLITISVVNNNDVKTVNENLDLNSDLDLDNKIKTDDLTDSKNEQVKTITKAINNSDNKIEFIIPVSGEIIKEFSNDIQIYNKTTKDWRIHRGLDIKCDNNSQIVSVCNGIVNNIYKDINYGYGVEIKKDNLCIRYFMLSKDIILKKGDNVYKGQSIGFVSNNDTIEMSDFPHLHIEILENNEYIDPRKYLSYN